MDLVDKDAKVELKLCFSSLCRVQIHFKPENAPFPPFCLLLYPWNEEILHIEAAAYKAENME